MESSNAIFSDQDALNQLQYDLLAFPFPTQHTDEASTFLSTDTVSLNYNVSAPSSDYGNTINLSPATVSFLPQNALSTPIPTPDYSTPLIHPHQEDFEEFLTPLVSPAITPSYTDIYQFLDPPNEQYFTPLSSPALPPNQYDDTSPSNVIQDAALLTQQLAHIETKQQLLRDQIKTSPAISPTYRKSPLAMFSSRTQAPPSPLPFSSKRRSTTTLRQKIALASPQLHSSKDVPTTPATPASLMNMSHHFPSSTSIPSTDKTLVDSMPFLPPAAVPESVTPSSSTVRANKARKLAPSTSPGSSTSSPRTLKPLLSPFLQPDLRSNNLIAPRTQSPGIENRRSAHKVAEQRRRDTLKQSFDALRKEITDVLVMDSGKLEQEKLRQEKEKEVKLMSKVLLLQHSYEYIIRLKADSRRKDDKMSKMQAELEKLRMLAQQKAK